MVSWTRADVVILTAIELEYAAVKLVEAGAAPTSGWVEDKHDGLPVALREFVGRSWGSSARSVRAANRSANPRGYRYGYLGFRLAGGQESAPR